MTPEKTCASCGASVSSMLKRCPKCNAAMGTPPAAPPAIGPNGKISLANAGANTVAFAAAPPPPPPTTAGRAATPAVKVHLGDSAAPPAAPAQGAAAAPPVVPAAQPKAEGSTPAAPPASPPAVQPPPPTATRARPRHLQPWIALGTVAAAAVALLIWFNRDIPTQRDIGVSKAVVQVSTDGGSGTGFFVKGPDEWAYVVTAFHVVACGCPITVARAIEISQDKYYIEAYPEAEIAAYDADSDLAVLRLRNVRASAFGTLNLATRPLKGGRIKSYGFPGRTLMRRQGLLEQEGSVLSIGRFPVVDERNNEVIRESGVEGILISSSLEPGYSGGPTCDEHGDVVGVNAIKDRTQTLHNGAISVDALRRLLGQVKPLEKRATPTTDEVKALLARVAQDYLRLPPEQRVTRREHEFIAVTDLPGLHAFTTMVRGMERRQGHKLDLEVFALTGLPLATYRHESVQQALKACELNAQRTMSFIDFMTPANSKKEKDDVLRMAMSECDEKAVRPLAWDLTAMTLHWDPHRAEHDFTISSVETVNDEEPEYRARVTLKGTQASFEVWVRWDGSELKLKLLDKEQVPYGLKATSSISGEALNGKWGRARPRSPLPQEPSMSLQIDETVEVFVGAGGHVAARHVVTAQLFAPKDKLACRREVVEGTLVQSLAGDVKPSGGLVERSRAELTAPAFSECGMDFYKVYAPQAMMALKSRGDRLIVYRTNGVDPPEEVEFARR